MQVSVETTEGLERKLTIQVPVERVDGVVEQRLQSMRKTVKINGFRPGKVPLAVVKKRYADQVRQEVLGEVVQSSYQEAITSESLNPAGMPQIEPVKMDAGEPLEYVATIEVYPEVSLASTESLEVEQPVAEVVDADIDEMIDNLRKQRTEWQDVEREAANDDRITVDFTGKIDGEAFEGGKAEKAPIVLGSGSMIPGFEDGLVGLKKGDETTINVTFPEDYQSEDLAGKAAEFAIVVHEVSEPKLPEVDDEFVKAFGVEEGGVEKLRADIRGNMERELKQAVDGRIKQQVMDGLAELNEFDLPSALVKDEVQRLRQQMVQQLSGQMPEGFDGSTFGDELFEENANRRVKLGLVIAEIVKENELKADADAVRAMIENIAASYQDPAQVVEYYYGNQELLQGVEGMVLEQAVTDLVLGQSKTTEKQYSFKELMNPPQPQPEEDSEEGA